MLDNRKKLQLVLSKRGYMNEDLVNEIEQIYNKEQLPIHGVVATLPNIDSNEFKEFLISEGFTKTLNSFLYKRGDDEYDKDVLYTHFCDVIEFGN